MAPTFKLSLPSISLASSETSWSDRVISTTQGLSQFLAEIVLNIDSPGTSLYLDIKGTNLCRHGTISLVTIFKNPQRSVMIIDILALGEKAFTTTAPDGTTTLTTLLEDPLMPTYLWDVRGPADALFHLYGVSLAGVLDLQLLENASRGTDSKLFLSSMDKCIHAEANMSLIDIFDWNQRKNRMKKRMEEAAKSGGSGDDVFSVRPLDDETIEILCNDALRMMTLHDMYRRRTTVDRHDKAKEETEKQLLAVTGPEYDVDDEDNGNLGPWGHGRSDLPGPKPAVDDSWVLKGKREG